MIAFIRRVLAKFGWVHDGVHHRKLTDKEVLEITRTYVRGSRVYGGRALAKKYGVSKSTIHNVVCGRKWRHIKPSKSGRSFLS